MQSHKSNASPILAHAYTLIIKHLNENYDHLKLTATPLPLRIRSFDTAESYHKALSTQPVGVKDQYQKASYYDYRKKA
jgi:hypothetical protein